MTALSLNTELMKNARLARDARFDGLFFIGVKTTGIFCRPICKARAPLEKNVVYYACAIEAMNQGFRPCLLCRPDSAPGSFAWKGVETTVERGMKLIGENFEASISDIADRLGVSTRYFNRLFNEYLQISPKQYQLYHRLLFAKKLLHESSLSIELVAQASGFSTARQMQIHMKKVTGLSPSNIRKKSADRSSHKNQELSVFLSYRPPYDWPSVRDFFKLRELHCNEKISDNKIEKVLTIKNQAVLIKAEHKAQKNGFEVCLKLPDVSLLKDSIRAVGKMLDLQSDSMLIAAAIAESGLPTRYIAKGLRLPGVVNQFEAACRAIIGQQVSVKAAISQLNLLHQVLYGNVEGGLERALEKAHEKGTETMYTQKLNAFVSPELVARADLSFLKMPQARKDTLKRLAQFVLDKPNAKPQEWLELKGIGPWTVNYVLMRNADIPDIFLDTDLVIKNRLLALGQKGVEIQPDNSAPWRSYLTLSLWAAESLVPVKE
ncbi:DNA-3-methyladenine glycosylase 2 family protein [Glaciecola sp. MH2013]|uniref:DNA-3-methyladenine glycosylase 2 family protein n=1 Tax=Glaciecola sp. MH2013 TaxID=2785524 RepID=UPI00189F13A1|nr:Ada metal-binding domain-containing protein [Glaciecola sp. MH2013]MBF7074293.1 DNA-3-methyladenine glycosylase 2 family protein [Glaciecola sp. MH2013]